MRAHFNGWFGDDGAEQARERYWNYSWCVVYSKDDFFDFLCTYIRKENINGWSEYTHSIARHSRREKSRKRSSSSRKDGEVWVSESQSRWRRRKIKQDNRGIRHEISFRCFFDRMRCVREIRATLYLKSKYLY